MESIKDALFDGNTFIWFRDLIIGKHENLTQVINYNFEAISKGYNYRDRKVEILEVELINKSVAPIILNYTGEYTFHNDYKYIELKAKSSKTIYIKTKKIKDFINLEFEILNYVVSPKTNLKTSKYIKIKTKI
jgi:hypothetical protein